MNKNSLPKFYIIIAAVLLVLSIPQRHTNRFRASLFKILKLPLGFLSNTSSVLIHHSDYKKLIGENKILQQKNAALSVENASLKYLRQENDNLLELLNMKKRLPYSSMASRVIGIDYSDTGRIIFLDRGRNYVKENMVCLNSRGLIGKIFEVEKEFSKCICLNDLNSRVPAKVERTQEQGLVYGTVNGIRLEMKYLNKNSKIQSGDRIITSGLGEVYPPGILIGTVLELREDANYKIAVILPAVDFLKLEEILLLGKNAK